MSKTPCFRLLRPPPRGFTLIEVLVVVAIIALLISILLPSLTQAREQSKIVRCLANEGVIAKATSMYLTANKERFPWGPRYRPTAPYSEMLDSQQNPLTRTWYFGGNRGQNSADLGTGGYYITGSDHDWAPSQRPLNKYVYPGAKLTSNDRRPTGKDGDLRVFQCPSDQGVRWNGDPNSDLNFRVTAYLEVGTSYQSNNSWGYYAKSKEFPSQPKQGKRIRQLMDRIVNILVKKGASRAVLIYEDTADWALNTPGFPYNARAPWQRYKVRTWHNKYDIHNLMFADGHAAATFVDWTKNLYTNDKAMTSTWVVRQFLYEEAAP